MKEEIKLEDVKLALFSLWKRKLIICLSAVVCFLIGILLTFNNHPSNLYAARATIYGAVYGDYQQTNITTAAMINYADVLSSMKVCERAEALLGNADITAADIQRMVTASSGTQSPIMTIRARSTSAETAVDVANAVAKAFVIELQTLLGTEGVQVLDYARESTMSESGQRSLMIYRMAFFVFGFAVSCVFLFLQALFSDRLQSIRQCIDSENKILGIIPKE